LTLIDTYLTPKARVSERPSIHCPLPIIAVTVFQGIQTAQPPTLKASSPSPPRPKTCQIFVVTAPLSCTPVSPPPLSRCGQPANLPRTVLHSPLLSLYISLSLLPPLGVIWIFVYGVFLSRRTGDCVSPFKGAVTTSFFPWWPVYPLFSGCWMRLHSATHFSRQPPPPICWHRWIRFCVYEAIAFGAFSRAPSRGKDFPTELIPLSQSAPLCGSRQRHRPGCFPYRPTSFPELLFFVLFSTQITWSVSSDFPPESVRSFLFTFFSPAFRADDGMPSRPSCRFFVSPYRTLHSDSVTLTFSLFFGGTPSFRS